MPERSKESWLPVVGFEDRYLVSNLGRVMSTQRVVHDTIKGVTNKEIAALYGISRRVVGKTWKHIT